MLASSLCDIDLDGIGVQRGYVRIPHSVHRSAYGFLPVPIACVAVGSGPTVLIMAGSHGDEYEGQVIVSELIRTVSERDVAGRLILLPMANFPAAMEATRTSPEDGGNLNRSFPGDSRGGPTARIAQFIEQELLTRAEIFIDLHSGGSSLLYKPTLMVNPTRERGQLALIEQVIEAFAPDYALVRERDEDGGYATTAASRHRAISFTAELGGAGAVDSIVRTRAMEGLIRALAGIGVWCGTVPPPAGTRPPLIQNEALVFADDSGIFEPLVGPGETVTAGQRVAWIHRPETPACPPIEILAPTAAVVLAKRVLARAVRGDCLFHIAWET